MKSPTGSLRNPSRIADDELIEPADDILDGIDDSGELLLNAASASKSADSFLEGYIEHDRCFHFHFGLQSASGERDFGQYCAIFEAALAKQPDLPRSIPSGLYTETCAPRKAICHGEQLMFISRVQFFKEPEGLHLRIRSHVWLAPSDFAQCVWMDPVFELSALDHLVKSRLRLVDRKQGAAVVELTPCESPSDVIEGASGVVDTIADHQSPSVLRYGFKDFELKEILRLFTIVSFVGGEGLRIEKGTHFRCNGVEMFFCPPNFLPAF